MSVLGLLFGGNKKIDKPIFIKDFSKENNQVKDLEELYEKVTSSEKKNLLKEISCVLNKVSPEKVMYILN